MIVTEDIKQRISVFLLTARKKLNKAAIKKHIDRVSKVQVRKKLVNFFKGVSWKSPKTVGAAGLGFILICAGIFYLSTTVSAVGIIVNGQNMGYAPNMTEARQVVQEVLLKQGEVSGQAAQTDDNIEYDKVRIARDRDAANQFSVSSLLGAVTPYIEGCGIRIGEEIVVYLASAEQADSVLAKFKDYFAKPVKIILLLPPALKKKWKRLP
jgi:hypothetical protein